MQTNIFRHRRKLAGATFFFALLFGLSAALLPRAYAQYDPNRKFSENHGIAFIEALQAMNAGEHQTALTRLDKMLAQQPDLNPYEKSRIYHIKAQAHFKLKQIAQGLRAYEDEINAGGLTDFETRRRGLNIENIRYARNEQERSAKPTEKFERCVSTIHSNKYKTMIVHHAMQLRNYDIALRYHKMGHGDKQLDNVKQMLRLWPNNETAKRAAVLFYKSIPETYRKAGREADAFKVEQHIYNWGFENYEKTLLKLAENHALHEMPYEAALILEREMAAGRISKTLKNIVLLSIFYQKAGHHDTAKAVFTHAAEMSGEPAAKKMIQDLTTPKKPNITPPPKTSSFKPIRITSMTPPKIKPRDRDAQPLVRIPPVIPQGLKKTGRCNVHFNVDPKGQPEDIIACFCTQKTLEEPAIESVKKWKYNPKFSEGLPTARTGVETRITFKVSDSDGNIIPE